MAIDISEQWLSQQAEDVQAVIRMLLEHIKKQDEPVLRLIANSAVRAELKARLGIHPQNSSRPPSTQHLHAKLLPKNRNPHANEAGRMGARKLNGSCSHRTGRSGRVLSAATCRRCGRDLAGEDAAPLRHQVFELPEFQPHVTEYQQHRRSCPKCGITTCGALPEGVPTHSAGPRLTAFMSLLMAHYRQSGVGQAVPDGAGY